MQKYFIQLLLLSIANFAIAQTINLKGKISSSGQNLSSASIQLKSYPDQELLTYGFSDENGNFDLQSQIDRSDQFLLIAAYIGYTRDTIKISRTTLLKQSVYMHNFILLEDKKQLDEIYIKAPQAVEVNNDTTKYNVQRFTSLEDRNLESVIKKMPGMEVNKDGTIFFKGKKISKVLLEGDDLTGEGYKAITKNLKPEFVEEVQALEHYVEDNLLRGIINSDDIVLNLKIKNKNAKKVVGSVDAGLGTIDRRLISTNLISFINKTKAFAFANHSNVNNASNGNVLELVDENRQFVGNNKIIRHKVGTYNPFDATQFTINQSTQGSLNAITRINDKFKLNYSLFYSWLKLYGLTSMKTIYFPPNNIKTEDTDNRNNLEKVLKTDFSADYLVKKNARLWAKFTYKYQPERYNSLAFSRFNDNLGDSVVQAQNDLNRNFNGHVKYTIKANQTTAYLFSAKILIDDVSQVYASNSKLYRTIPTFNNASGLIQNVSNNNFKLKVDFEGLKRYNKSFVYLNVGNEINRFKLNSNLTKSDENPIGKDFTNYNLFDVNQTYVLGKYVYDDQPIKIIAQLKSTLQLLKNMQKDSTYLLLEPILSFNYKPDQVQSISLTYSYRNNNPQPIEYYQNYILTDVRNFNSGLTNFFNYNSHSLGLVYGYNDFLNSYFNSNISLNASYSRYGFLYTNFFENTFNYFNKQPFSGIRNFSASINIKKFIPALSFTITGNYAPAISSYYNQFGNAARKYTSINHSIDTKINTGFNLPVNFGIGSELMMNSTNSMRLLVAKNNAYKYIFEYRYRLSNEIFNFSTYQLYRINGQQFNLIDTEFQYNPSKGSLKFSLQGKNLANIKAFTNLNINEISSSEFSSSILGRYVMASISMSIK